MTWSNPDKRRLVASKGKMLKKVNITFQLQLTSLCFPGHTLKGEPGTTLGAQNRVFDQPNKTTQHDKQIFIYHSNDNCFEEF